MGSAEIEKGLMNQAFFYFCWGQACIRALLLQPTRNTQECRPRRPRLTPAEKRRNAGLTPAVSQRLTKNARMQASYLTHTEIIADKIAEESVGQGDAGQALGP